MSKRRGIPRRDAPLEGTKQLLHPKDGDLRQLVAGAVLKDARIGRDARVFGWVSLGLAALMLPGYLLVVIMQRLGGDGWQRAADSLVTALIAAFFLTHLCTGLSQLFSNWQESNGVKGLMLCWASVAMMPVAEWMIALLSR